MNGSFSNIPEPGPGVGDEQDEVPPTVAIHDATTPATLPPEDQVRFLCEQFETAWRRAKDQRPRIGASLDDAPAGFRDRLFMELLRVDLDYRIERLDLPQPSDYLVEFPNDAQRVHSAFYARQLDKLFLGRKLGSGAMGSVFKALHVRLRRMVAVKMIQADRLDDVRWKARFRRESEACGAMRHPNVVYVNDAGEFEGNHYLEMEWIDGFDLGRLCGRVAAADACELIRQAADGLQSLHEHGFVHRDLKPSNLMLSRDCTCKVLDLGLVQVEAGAVSISEGGMLGTVAYMSPEQCKNPKAVDIRSDIYGLGCTLYHLLTGSVPFGPPRHESLLSVIAAHRDEPPPPIRQSKPELDATLEAVVLKMMAKDPADRYATPAEVAAALVPFTSGSDLRRLLEAKGFSTAKATQSGSLARGSDPTRPQSTSGAPLASDLSNPKGSIRRPNSRALLAWGGGLFALVAVLATIGWESGIFRAGDSGQAVPAAKDQAPARPIADWTFVPLLGNPASSPFQFLDGGVIHCDAKGSRGALLSNEEFSDFVLTFDFQLRAAVPGNAGQANGIVVRCAPVHWRITGVEIDLTAARVGDLRVGKNVTLGTRSDRVSPDDPSLRLHFNGARSENPWHTMEVICDGGRLQVKHNGLLVNQGSAWNRRSGKVGLLAAGQDMQFRNVQIKPIDPQK